MIRQSPMPSPSPGPGPSPGTPLSFQNNHSSNILAYHHSHLRNQAPSSLRRKDQKSNVAIDPVTLVINECMIISSAMRKSNRWSQSGVAAILGAGDIFGGSNDHEFDAGDFSSHISSLNGGDHHIGGGNNSSSSRSIKSDSPLLSSFFQLRSILTEATTSLHTIDSLTLLQPFLLVIKSSSTSGHITSLALNSISKFLRYNIISEESNNIQNSVIQIISSLTHCRFEAADQNSDDSVLLKVLKLLEVILESDLSNLLSNEVVSEVVQTCLSLACNKKRSEVLRKAAEMSMFQITFRIFSQLKDIEPESLGSDDLQTNFSQTQLPEDIIGGTENASKIDLSVTTEEGTPKVSSESTRENESEQANDNSKNSPLIPPFGIVCINEFLGILISMISPTNQYQHMESTRVFALSLINTAIEVSGEEIVLHPSLMSLVSDSICKHDLQIMTTSDSPALLQASLQLFTTIAIVLGKYLKSQIELTLTLIFKSILPPPATKKPVDPLKSAEPTNLRLASSKEMLIESMSLLWTRSPLFFTHLFINYDCDFERSDLSAQVLEYLCQLSLPESASITTDNVPPICLESILGFIASINDRTKLYPQSSAKNAQQHKLILDKDKKMSFVKCTELLNNNPKEGVKALKEKGFIKNFEDIDEVAEFFFSKSGRLNKKVLGEYLAKPSNVELLKKFIGIFEFGGLRVDEALRILLKSFRLPGESQQIERVVEIFAERYVKCQEEEDNKEKENIEQKEKDDSKDSGKNDDDNENENELVRPDKDAVFILSYSIIMLNTDQHNPQVKQQMDLDSYKRNLRGIYNGKDFPTWYLSKIYHSIKDREIIMPEEHHGTDKWFDDAWHNLVSSQGVNIVNEEVNHDEFNNLELIIQFDKVIFKESVDKIINTLIRVFKEASDDHIITRLMSSIDKCASICMYYELDESIDKLISELADQTRLTDKKYRQSSVIDEKAGTNNNVTDSPSGTAAAVAAGSAATTLTATDDLLRDEIPITQIQVESKSKDGSKPEVITVSEMAVWFGREFKAQISMVVLFRLIKKIDFKITPSWNKIVKIILTLFENCLINPNLFGDFQKRLSMSPLPKVKPKYIINRSKPLKDSGLLSTFSSFLKGYSDVPPEPTDQEVESTLSTIDCVKSINIASVFENVATKSSPQDLTRFVNFFINLLPIYNEEYTKRFYESESLFIFEIVVCFALLTGETENINKVIKKLHSYADSKSISKKGQLRIITYKLLLFRKSDGIDDSILTQTIADLSAFDNEVIVKSGSQLIPALISLVDKDSWCSKQLLSSESYWAIFRALSTVANNSKKIVVFITDILHDDDTAKEINPKNYMTLLGLLDEISSLGAIGSQYEQNPKANSDDYPKELIASSKKSISLTSELSIITQREEFIGNDLSYSLYQALAHQCFNPCREIRSFAISILQSSILQVELEKSELSSDGIFEYVLFPLLSELSKEEVLLTDPKGFVKTRVEVLSVVSKVYLNFNNNLKEGDTERIWLGFLDHMINFQEINKKSQQVQQKQNQQKATKVQSPAIAEGVSDEDQETGLEVLKNIILVLQDNGVLVKEKEELWQESAKRINVLDPNLRKTLLSDVVEDTKKEEVTTEATTEKESK